MAQVYAPVKDKLAEVKQRTKLKNESEVIAYLWALYESRYDRLGLKEHQEAMDQARELHNQMTL